MTTVTIPSANPILSMKTASAFDGVLMDSGGLPYRDTIPWLNEGIKRITSVATGELESSDWSRETWGVELRNPTAKIYSLHDEEYVQTLSLDGFSKVLRAWTAFLESKPDDLGDAEARNVSID